MTKALETSSIKVLIRGGGDIASGAAWRLFRCGFRVYLTEVAQPMAVRRKVSFCEAVYEGEIVVEGVKARLIRDPKEVTRAWEQEQIPVLIDPEGESKSVTKPEVLGEAI